MNKKSMIAWMLLLCSMPVCAQDADQPIEIDTTLVFNKAWFSLRGNRRQIEGQVYYENYVNAEIPAVEGIYGPCDDETYPAPPLPWFQITLPMPEDRICREIEVSCERGNLLSQGYRMVPGYYTNGLTAKQKDSLFVVMQNFEFEFQKYPEQQARYGGLWPSARGSMAVINVTPCSYEPEHELIVFYPVIHIHAVFSKPDAVGISDPTFNRRSAQDDAPHLNNSVDSHSFDLSGRRLAASPVKGMYIENGRKFIK